MERLLAERENSVVPMRSTLSQNPPHFDFSALLPDKLIYNDLRNQTNQDNSGLIFFF